MMLILIVHFEILYAGITYGEESHGEVRHDNVYGAKYSDAETSSLFDNMVLCFL